MLAPTLPLGRQGIGMELLEVVANIFTTAMAVLSGSAA
ncbi:hypothetical protein BJY24_005451 [Nocardia transvalensis]|uniref:Uncharacterized protein n=1 Tax=Nocardia transvalensis TaxID=37333 RepID=A0A7W9PI10_9NOCA|nr:hypothetical protein [Nocardia transvalensis]